MGDSRCVFCMCGSFTILRKVTNSTSDIPAVKINPLMSNDDYTCRSDYARLLVRTESAQDGLV